MDTVGKILKKSMWNVKKCVGGMIFVKAENLNKIIREKINSLVKTGKWFTPKSKYTLPPGSPKSAAYRR